MTNLVEELRGPDETGHITASRCAAANEIERLQKLVEECCDAHDKTLLELHAHQVRHAIVSAQDEPKAPLCDCPPNCLGPDNFSDRICRAENRSPSR